MAEKAFEKRFGFTAVEKGMINFDQLVKAMKLQVQEELFKKKHRFIGEILVEMGYMNQSQVDEVVESGE